MSSGVIVGYDGSDCAKAALRTAAGVAKAYGDKLIVAFGYELSPVAGELHDYHLALRELATKRVAEATKLAVGEGADVEGAVVEKQAAHGLAELAVARDARLIVVGTRGESPLRGALLGSTAHKLLHLADRPVLVVPAPDGH
ncbi:MAG: universal stress protein [Solirubrobacteraceae bacterium]|jgi:nucleotide-binding universal stress UspA family protein